MKTLMFIITGMTCANCAANLERQLKKLKGVSNVQVNFASEKATISFEPELVDEKVILQKIRDTGFDVATKKFDDMEQTPVNEAYKGNIRLLAFGLIFTAPLFAISMSADMGLLPEAANQTAWLKWLMFILALPVQIVLGAPHYKAAFYSIRAGSANMDVLVAIGSSAAFLYSVPTILNLMHGHVYFETAAVILTLIRLGKTIESRVKASAGEAISRLISLKPLTASRLKDDREEKVPTNELRSGDIVIVRPGESIPTDGIIKKGIADLNEAMLTGESMPKKKQAGDTVFGGTLNEDGLLVVEVTKVGSDTVLSRIIRLMEEAQASKPAIQRLADRVSAVFVPAVILAAVLTFIGWELYLWQTGSGADVSAVLMHSVAVLVIACPCAMGLATPTAVMAGAGRAAQFGILIRSGEALERTGSLEVAVFDKTGTITKGKPSVTACYMDNDMASKLGVTKEEALRLSASVENASQHPVARAIVEHAAQVGIELTEAENVKAHQGLGMSADVMDFKLVIGNRKLMEKEGCTLSQLILEAFDAAQVKGETAVIVAINQITVMAISVSDTIKPEAADVVQQLEELGIDVMLLSGDNFKSASAVASIAGIKKTIAEVLPEEKLNEIKKIQAIGKRVAMIGDGINDAPALAIADVGISMGTGADVAMAATPIILITGDLTAVPKAIILSKLTVKTIKQNLFWAFFYNILLIPAAAFGLLNPMLAAMSMAFSSVFVVLNSLRLKRIKL